MELHDKFCLRYRDLIPHNCVVSWRWSIKKFFSIFGLSSGDFSWSFVQFWRGRKLIETLLPWSDREPGNHWKYCQKGILSACCFAPTPMRRNQCKAFWWPKGTTDPDDGILVKSFDKMLSPWIRTFRVHWRNIWSSFSQTLHGAAALKSEVCVQSVVRVKSTGNRISF